MTPAFDHASTFTVQADGLTATVHSAGSGQPWVLLHGLGDSSQGWRWIAPELARHARVVAIDLPVHLGPEPHPAVLTPVQLAQVVQEVMRRLRLEDAVLVGNSLGGLVAMHVALNAPQRVQRLVLIDSAGLGRELHWSLRMIALPGAGEAQALWARTPLGRWQRMLLRSALMFQRQTRCPEQWQRDQIEITTKPRYFAHALALLRGASDGAGQLPSQILLDQLPKLQRPTLLVWGHDDKIVPRDHAERAHARLPQSQLHVIDDCGHVPQVEKPHELLRILQHAARNCLADQKCMPRG